jgi:hypothetical protein
MDKNRITRPTRPDERASEYGEAGYADSRHSAHAETLNLRIGEHLID